MSESTYKRWMTEAYINEADDDDNYVHVGGGRYKEVNKATGEPLPNSPSYIKKDGGGYEMVDDDDPRLSKGDDDKGGDEPEDEPAGKLGGGDYERDGGEPEDKPFGGDTGKDADSDSDDSSGGKLVAIDYQEDGDTWQVELDGLDNDVVVPGSEADTEEEAEEVARKMAAIGDDEFDPDKHGLDKYSSDDEDDEQDDEEAAKAQAFKDMEDEKEETIKVINGKKYKAIKESKKPTLLQESKMEIRKMWDRIK